MARNMIIPLLALSLVVVVRELRLVARKYDVSDISVISTILPIPYVIKHMTEFKKNIRSIGCESSGFRFRAL